MQKTLKPIKSSIFIVERVAGIENREIQLSVEKGKVMRISKAGEGEAEERVLGQAGKS